MMVEPPQIPATKTPPTSKLKSESPMEKTAIASYLAGLDLCHSKEPRRYQQWKQQHTEFLRLLYVLEHGLGLETGMDDDPNSEDDGVDGKVLLRRTSSVASSTPFLISWYQARLDRCERLWSFVCMQASVPSSLSFSLWDEDSLSEVSRQAQLHPYLTPLQLRRLQERFQNAHHVASKEIQHMQQQDGGFSSPSGQARHPAKIRRVDPQPFSSHSSSAKLPLTTAFAAHPLHKMTTTTTSSGPPGTQTTKWQRQQRAQLEQEVALLSQQLKRQTQHIHDEIQWQTTALLEGLEDGEELLEEQLTDITRRVRRHNQQQHRSTSTLQGGLILVMLVCVFVLMLLIVAHTPKRRYPPCLWYCPRFHHPKQPSQQRIPIREQRQLLAPQRSNSDTSTHKNAFCRASGDGTQECIDPAALEAFLQNPKGTEPI